MANALEVSKYITIVMSVDNLKLQKLLYYCQAINLVKYNEPLFNDDIEALQFGPVVPVVYRAYKKFGFEDIKQNKSANLITKDIEVIDLVLEYYGSMSSIYLVNKTHSEDPWKNVYKPNKDNIKITNESIKEYYSKTISFE